MEREKTRLNSHKNMKLLFKAKNKALKDNQNIFLNNPQTTNQQQQQLPC